MPRKAREVLAGYPHHVILRGLNRQSIFLQSDDFQKFMDLVFQREQSTNLQIHAYVLMDNHVHLLVTPLDVQALSAFVKSFSQKYVQYFNFRYKRTGTLWEGRFKSYPIKDDAYALACQRYIELNPVKAKMVAHPRDYLWSSYCENDKADSGAEKRLAPLPMMVDLEQAGEYEAYVLAGIAELGTDPSG